MWDFFSKLMDALPPWFLMALITFLLAAAAWTLPRLRRDKNGKWYIYSRSYEHQKNRIKAQRQETGNLTATINDMNKTMADSFSRVNARMKSIECENLKQTFYITNESFPKKERLIAGLKYVDSGGNGMTREDVARFVKDNPAVYGEVMKDFPQWALPKEDCGGGDG